MFLYTRSTLSAQILVETIIQQPTQATIGDNVLVRVVQTNTRVPTRPMMNPPLAIAFLENL